VPRPPTPNRSPFQVRPANLAVLRVSSSGARVWLSANPATNMPRSDPWLQSLCRAAEFSTSEVNSRALGAGIVQRSTNVSPRRAQILETVSVCRFLAMHTGPLWAF